MNFFKDLANARPETRLELRVKYSLNKFSTLHLDNLDLKSTNFQVFHLTIHHSRFVSTLLHLEL